MKQRKRTARREIRLEPSLDARLVSAAVRAGLTVTDVVEAGIDREVRRLEKAQKEVAA